MKSFAYALLVFGAASAASAWEPGVDDPEAEYETHSMRAVPRDVFPVFDDPHTLSAATASPRLRPREWVIGVSIGGAHRAYPVEMMGVAELGNDTLGGHPIAVCW